MRRNRVNGTHGLDLRFRQAIRSVPSFAEQHRWVVLAPRWVLDDSVGDTIFRIAGIQRSAMDHRIFGRRNVAGWSLVCRLVYPHLVNTVACAVVGEPDSGRGVQIPGVSL